MSKMYNLAIIRYSASLLIETKTFLDIVAKRNN